MSIEKMSLVQIVGSLNQLDAALLQCCESELFHIDHPLNDVEGFHPLEEDNPHTAGLQSVTDVLNLLKIPLHFASYEKLSDDEERLLTSVQELKAQVVELNRQRTIISDDLSIYRQSYNQLEHLKGLTIEFETILSSKNVTARFGRLPVDSFLKLDYFSNKLFVFFDFDHDDDYYWGVYFSPNKELDEADHIFDSLYFERIDVPQFAHGTPEQSAESIREMILAQEKLLADNGAQFKTMQKDNREHLLSLFSRLKMLNDTFAYRRYASVAHSQFYLKGFVPRKQVEKFIHLFDGLDQVVCEEDPVENDRSIEPPVQLHTNWFFKPFEMFVKMYGLPNYYDINPTSFVGLVYVVLFGIMFGDLGQGFVICLLGIFLWKKRKMELGAIMSRLGISSMIFGTAYGSVFGLEDVLDPMFKFFGFAKKPIEVFDVATTNMLLVSAVGIGVVILLSCIGINIYLGFKRKNMERAVLSNNGLVGLILYGGSILAAALLLTSGINLFNPVFIIIVIILPLLLLMFKEPIVQWVHHKKVTLEGGAGSFILQNFFELFEVCLSYVTNTLSFLRVGGFILSHAGMMAVVMSLAEMAGGGSPVVLVIGNIFVICLEGLLSGIQVLRLTFYEMFSRFYEGDGKPFEPAKVEFPSEDA